MTKQTHCKMNRICHNYKKWEDWKAGMYSNACDNIKDTISDSLELLSSPTDLHEAMMRVCNEWVYSSEHNLTDISINRQAWLGQAACCFNHGCPEQYTRLAWWSLSEKQRNEANTVADIVIQYYERWHKSRNQYSLFKEAA